MAWTVVMVQTVETSEIALLEVSSPMGGAAEIALVEVPVCLGATVETEFARITRPLANCPVNPEHPGKMGVAPVVKWVMTA